MAEGMGSRGRACPQALSQGPTNSRGPMGVLQGTPILFFPSANAQPCPGSRELPGEALSSALQLPSQSWRRSPGCGARCPSSGRAGQNAPQLPTLRNQERWPPAQAPPTPSQGSRLWAGVCLPEPLPSCWAGKDPLPAAHKVGLSVPSPLSCGSTQQPMTQPEPADSTGLKLRAVHAPLPRPPASALVAGRHQAAEQLWASASSLVRPPPCPRAARKSSVVTVHGVQLHLGQAL